MKITDYISVKPAYEALEAVRARMPSTETAKSWVVEPIKSAWSKPTGKAVFIAVGAMATLAIAIFQSILARKNRPKLEQVKLSSLTQSQEYLEYQENFYQWSYGALMTWKKEVEGQADDPKNREHVCMMVAASDTLKIKREWILSSLGVDLLDVLTYKFKVKTPANFNMAVEEKSQSSILSLSDCVKRYKMLKIEHDKSVFKNERFEIQSRLVVLQELIIKKYNELNVSLG